MHEHQSEEFALRGQHLPTADVIRSATLDGAIALGYDGKLGTVAAGAFADLITVDGNPLETLPLLAGQVNICRIFSRAENLLKVFSL